MGSGVSEHKSSSGMSAPSGSGAHAAGSAPPKPEGIRKVAWSTPDIGAAEKQAVDAVLDSGWLGMGPKTKAFEAALTAYTGAQHSIVVNNGTSALLTAYLAHGIRPGDEVLLPTYTFVATVSSAIALGVQPVMVDADPHTFNVGPKEFEAALAKHPKAKAIVCVDVAGLPCDLDAIRAFAEKHHLILIEDAAEAFGAAYKGTRVGNYDHTTIFSFHIAKQVTTIEGGALQTNRPEIAEKSRLIRSHGEGKEKYIHVDLGLNFRPTDLQSAFGLVQLAKADQFLDHRQALADIYMRELKGHLTFQTVPEYATRPTWMIFLALAQDKKERDALNSHLNTNGVDTRIAWPPVHQQPYYKARYGPVDCPVADHLYERVVSLPIGNATTPDEIHQVVKVVRAFYDGKR